MNILSTVGFIFLLMLFPLYPLQQEGEQQERTVIIEVVDANGNPLRGVQAELTVRKPVTRVECSTDSEGRCALIFNSDENLVQGIILLKGSGRQSVIFKGPSVTVPMQLSETGVLNSVLDIHEHHGEEGETENHDEVEHDEPLLDQVSSTPFVSESSGQEPTTVIPTKTPLVVLDADETLPDVGEVTESLPLLEEGEGVVSASNSSKSYIFLYIVVIVLIGLLGAAGWYIYNIQRKGGTN